MKIVEEKNRFVLYDDKEEVGEMTFVDRGDIFVINHTYVNPNYRGQKFAEQLVASGIEKARREKRKIFPTCPFAVREFALKPDYKDVLAESLS